MKQRKEKEYFYNSLGFEVIKINSAYKDYSTSWFVRMRLTPEQENEIIRNGKKASKNKKIPDKDFIKPIHHDIVLVNGFVLKVDIFVILQKNERGTYPVV